MLWTDFITEAGGTRRHCLQLTPISFSNTKGNQWGPADLWVPPGN